MVDQTITKVYKIAHDLRQQQEQLEQEMGEMNAPVLINYDLYYAILEMKDAHVNEIDSSVIGMDKTNDYF